MPIKRNRDAVGRELHRARQRLASVRRSLAGIPHRLAHARNALEGARITTSKNIAERELVRLPDKIAELEAELAAMPADAREPHVGAFGASRLASLGTYRSTPMSAAEIGAAADLEIPEFLKRST